MGKGGEDGKKNKTLTKGRKKTLQERIGWLAGKEKLG